MGILNEFSLAGRKAVVTGGGKGIGRGIALCLAEAGADVLVTSRTQADVDSVAAEIAALDVTGVGFAANATARCE